MKIEKLDQKQVPQVIALGVLAAGVMGYAVYSITFGGPKRTPPTDAGISATSTAATPTEGAPTPGTQVQVAKSTVPDLNLPSQFNPDPFKSSEKSVGITTVTSAPKPVEKARALGSISAPIMPDIYRIGDSPVPLPKVEVAVPPKPEKPEVHVTGTSVVDGMNLALLEVGQDHRVVQVGDMVGKGYWVKKIQLEGVVFANKKDSFFRPVGAKDEPKKDEETAAAKPEL